MARYDSNQFDRAMALVACMGVWGCGEGDSRPFVTEAETSLEVSVHDLETGIRPEVITIDLRTYSPWLTREEFEAGELPSWNENFRLVRWPDTTPVEGTWVFTPEPTSGEMAFAPERELEDGWYAVQIRPDRLSVRRGFNLGYQAATRDGWATARFHVGSFPLLLLSGGVSHPEDGRSGGGSLRFVASEPVFAGTDFRAADIVSITVGGERLTCSTVPEGAAAGERVRPLSFTCPDPGPRAALTIDVGALDWRSESGLQVRACGRSGTAHWEAFTGDYLDWADCDLEALLRSETP